MRHQQLQSYTPAMTAAGSTQDDVANIGKACQSVASSQGIDSRLILALVLQESTGYVGVTTTTNVDGQGTGGLMQTSGCQGYPGQKGLTAVCTYLAPDLMNYAFRACLWQLAGKGDERENKKRRKKRKQSRKEKEKGELRS